MATPAQRLGADRLAYDRLVNHALEGMLAGLDPHSSFIHPEMAALMKEKPGMNPSVPSLGLTMGLRDDGPYVAVVEPLGPASAAGVIPGSSVMEIDGRRIDVADFSDCLGALRRPAGATTRLLLKSPATPKPEEVSLTHRLIEEHSVSEVRFL